MIHKTHLAYACLDVVFKWPIADNMDVNVAVNIHYASDHVDHQQRILLLNKTAWKENLEAIRLNRLHWDYLARVEFHLGIYASGYHANSAATRLVVIAERTSEVFT